MWHSKKKRQEETDALDKREKKMETRMGRKQKEMRGKYGGYNKGIDSERIWELPNIFCLDL